MKGMGNVLYRYLQSVQGLLAPAIAAVFILGVFWKRTSPAAGLWGLIVGFGLGMFRLVLDVIIGGPIADAAKLPAAEKLAKLAQLQEQYGILYRIEALNWLHVCITLFIICIVTMIIISLMSKAPAQAQMRYTYGAATLEQKAVTRASWNGWDILHTAVILGVIAAFYIYFW
jgi:SSS family solute:Na+ symporter